MIQRLSLGLVIFLGSLILGRFLLLTELGWRAPWHYLIEWIFLFPFKLFLTIYPLLRLPGYDDIQYGGCRVPYCDTWSILITVLISAALYYLLAHFFLSIYQRRYG